jgi:hypothetical protein
MMYRIALTVDWEKVIVEIGEDVDIGKFVFWCVQNEYVIDNIEKITSVKEKGNSTVGNWLIESYKKEEKFKGE